MVGLAAQFTENDANNSLIQNGQNAAGFGGFDNSSDNATNNNPLLEPLYILQRWGKHVRVVGQPDELDVARYVSNMPRLKTIRQVRAHRAFVGHGKLTNVDVAAGSIHTTAGAWKASSVW